jgi:hypothetical protein
MEHGPEGPRWTREGVFVRIAINDGKLKPEDITADRVRRLKAELDRIQREAGR